MQPTDEPEAVVSRLWHESRSEQPSARLNAAEPAGVDLAALDVRLSGCLHTWLFHRDSFDGRHLRTVRALLHELERALPALTEEDDLRFWRRYQRMAQLVLEHSPHASG
ncbi:hypothetical protein OH807_40440 [Kitasatospora sp. NBC_01560]|uniref:hypothetical protein n=1 Tax=Kitasatospora sp. NBC_01560 TaxID=2975965 RepID=UPI0038660967